MNWTSFNPDARPILVAWAEVWGDIFGQYLDVICKQYGVPEWTKEIRQVSLAHYDRLVDEDNERYELWMEANL